MRWLGYLWSLPNTLIGLLLCLAYGVESWQWSDGCLEIVAERRADGRTRIWYQPGAQTWGWLTFYASEARRLAADLRVHERVHVADALWQGIFFMLSWGLQFVWQYLVVKPAEPAFEDPVWRAYLAISHEAKAYRIQWEYLSGLRPMQWGSGPP